MTAKVPLQEQPFISHLIELRDRLMRMMLAVLVIFLVLFPFGNDIYVFIADPLMRVLPEGTTMIATQVASPFLTPFKLALVTAVFAAMPYLLHQVWGFIAPGLYYHERRLALPLLASSILLFYLGAAFAYFVVFPLVFAFLTAAAPEGVAVMTDITHYLDFVLTLFFAFGLAFEVPIATIMLVLAGVTTPEDLASKRPYVIVGAFVIGMMLTPPDIISQTLLALPMWVLFEIGILLSRVIVRMRQREEESEYAEQQVGGALATGAAAGAASAADEGDFSPLDEHEMEDEFSRIEREFAELERQVEKEAAEQRAAHGQPADADDVAKDAADAGQEAGAADQETEYDHAAEVNQPSQDTPGPDTPAWTEQDGADMLDEEAFPARSAVEALVDAKLEQVAALRATEAFGEARRLLYEVLSEGNPQQVKVARNILEQLDS